MHPLVRLATLPFYGLIAWWDAVLRLNGYDYCPDTPADALVLTCPDGTRIALYPASSLR